jgi:hypothetical protein
VLPIRLAFEVCPVAAGAVFVVGDLAACDELWVIGVGLSRFVGREA